MLKVNSNDTIRIHYNLTLDDDSVIENSFGGDPLEFTIGDNQLIPGFEKSVIGMCKNESEILKIPMDEAYGPYLDEKIVVVERDELSKDIILAEGQSLFIKHSDGCVSIVKVIGLSRYSATIDFNHPLAGKDLIFDIMLKDIL